MKLKTFLTKYRFDLVCLTILCLTLPLFFYKLGQTSLGSWDEAWYGAIAKNMVRSGDILHMEVNTHPFSDHPLGGIWIMALVYKLFGVSEFTTRLPSAVMGFLSLWLIYFLGRQLFNRVVGLASALALCSSFWFLYRARLGDLDAPLIFFFLLTLLLAILASAKKKYLLAFAVSFGYLTTIKSALPFAIVPVLILIFYRAKSYRIKDYLLLFFLPLFFCLVFFGLWLYLINLQDPELVRWHFFHSGRNASLSNNALYSFSLFKEYLHNGIGKWFWPGMVGLVGGLILRQKRFLILVIFFLCYSLPFLSSPLVGIWHLIPLYPVMILAFFGFAFTAGQMILEQLLKNTKLAKPYLVKVKNSYLITSILLLSLATYFSAIQLRQAWYQFIDISDQITAEAALAKEAAKIPYRLSIDGDFIPVAVFYSDKEVEQYSLENLKPFFDRPGSNLIITRQWRLERSQIPPSSYQLIKQNQDLLLILKK